MRKGVGCYGTMVWRRASVAFLTGFRTSHASARRAKQKAKLRNTPTCRLLLPWNIYLSMFKVYIFSQPVIPENTWKMFPFSCEKTQSITLKSVRNVPPVSYIQWTHPEDWLKLLLNCMFEGTLSLQLWGQISAAIFDVKAWLHIIYTCLYIVKLYSHCASS